jgi:hypothetical protein
MVTNIKEENIPAEYYGDITQKDVTKISRG